MAEFYKDSPIPEIKGHHSRLMQIAHKLEAYQGEVQGTLKSLRDRVKGISND